ncbi:MAG: NADH-quinone oxidoreductase subunit L [Verrucomicrobia bacterium]|jgi:bidirectional [NiFe] hydrogenase diaphorase subunit|nr:NADH-quinone oxidoreductase subunit L [Verrucomicrobiota bacterium]MBT7069103.1 NADH-quinone oxidoreductase subunit L [Verrucomicrobiota bacterium]MBT7701406.1 NADH-quinone oxidoreductase subunit L [Verrucomicrobiota bacterium]
MPTPALKQTREAEQARQAGFVCRVFCCAGTACLSAEGQDVWEALCDARSTHRLDERVDLVRTGCMGLCSQGPLVRVEIAGAAPRLYGTVSPMLARLIITEHVTPALTRGDDFVLPEFLSSHALPDDLAFFTQQERVVLDRIDQADPERIQDALAHGAYSALADALECRPAELIEEIRTSGLRGRGGGGYPTGQKWANAAGTAAEQRFIICNGDEGDPGAYVDRSILEGDPHAVIEGMLLAGHAVGARRGYVYVRAEYELAVRRVSTAIKQAREQGILGDAVLGSPFRFDCEVITAAGAFVCGEETALIKSIEGQRGTPRPRPPYPSERGLWGCPTVISNVETLANLPRIIARGADWFRTIGTTDSPGTKVFSLAGRARLAGLLEVPMGTSLRTVIDTLGGGSKTGRPVCGVQIGGLSGGLIPAEQLDTTLSYEAMSELGSVVGSGGMIVLDEDDDLLDLACYFLQYAVEESCGRCAACRIGTHQLLNLATKIRQNGATDADLALIDRLAKTMQATSLCGLGKAAPRPLMSFLRNWPERIPRADTPDGGAA